MKKRILSAFLALVLLISSTDMRAFAMPAQDFNYADSDAEQDTNGINPDTDQDASNADSDITSDDATDTNDTDSDTNPNPDPDTDTDPDSSTADSGMLPDSELPSNSMTQSFLVDTEEPYDGDYLLAANVSIDEDGASEAVGSLLSEDCDSSNYNNVLYASGDYIFSTEDPYVYDFDENGIGLIDPASFLPEPVFSRTAAEYQASQESVETNYSIGDERVFYLKTTSETAYNPVDCVCAAISEYCTVWIPIDDPIYVYDSEKMRGYMNELAIEFDSQFPKMTEMFGSKETVDKLYGDNDGKTALLCYDISGDGASGGSSYTAGYFYSGDLNINYSNKTNNNIDCLHIDSWQAMSRNTSNNTLNPISGKRTMVHELQHMINFSICRDNESTFLQLKIPTYLNEAYSEAAAHLCYGEATSRISNYNSNTGISVGSVSLIKWNNNSSLGNYALSYLFSQYIRTQYENGETIYKDTMNSLNESTDLLSVIAEKLGVSTEELLLNFRAALFLKNADGIYGFGGEAWAETIRSNSTKAADDLTVAPGAAVVVPISDSFVPDGAGGNIRFAGMYADFTTDDILVDISGGDSISEYRGELQLQASVSAPKGISRDVIFFLPYSEDAAYAQVSTSGLVSALADGVVTVRAASVYDPSRYADIKITISKQRLVTFEKAVTPVLGGIRADYSVIEPEGAVLYYTTDGEIPSTDSEAAPEDGLLFNKAGSYVLKVLFHDPDEIYTDVFDEEEIVIEQFAEPVISVETKSKLFGSQLVTINADEGAAVYYTTDSSEPSIENGIEYTAPFTIETPGTTIVKAIASAEGMAVSETAAAEADVVYEAENMTDSERVPYLTQVSFSLNKNAVGGTQFSIIPIMENKIVDAKLINHSNDFRLERVQGTNDWKISLVNKGLTNGTYQSQVRVVSNDADEKGYIDVINIKIQVTDVKPKVTLNSITINTAYLMAAYPLTAVSKNGNVEILGLSSTAGTGLADRIEIEDGMLKIKSGYIESIKASGNKPELSGKIQVSVQVEGYEPQDVSLNVKSTNKAPKLVQSVSSIRLNYNKLNQDKSFVFTLSRQLSSKQKQLLENITNVSLNENGGTNYQKARALIQQDNLLCEDGINITVPFKNIKSGTYTLPLLVSADAGEDSFSNVSCNVKIIIDKENVNPSLKLSSSKLKLNRQTRGEKAYITVNSVSQYNMELSDLNCEYAEVTKSVNLDENVSLVYNADKNMLEAQITGEPAGKTYKFICTPEYNKAVAQDGTSDATTGNKLTVTIVLIDKAPSVSLKAKGSIDVLNRDTSSITYTIKKVNFTDGVETVKFKRASKQTNTILDAAEYFNEPKLNEDSTITITAKEDADFIKGMKYAFKLEFTLEDSKTSITPEGISVETKDIIIKPKQSKVKLSASSKPVFYTYVNTGNNAKALRLINSNGAIDKVEWNTDADRKLPSGIKPIFDDNGQLTGVTFDGDGRIKKGNYKLTLNVYYKGQLLEKATGTRASYAKPTVFRLTVSVK